MRNLLIILLVALAFSSCKVDFQEKIKSSQIKIDGDVYVLKYTLRGISQKYIFGNFGIVRDDVRLLKNDSLLFINDVKSGKEKSFGFIDSLRFDSLRFTINDLKNQVDITCYYNVDGSEELEKLRLYEIDGEWLKDTRIQ